ncbi:MAG: 3'(2'),5'-bisphosphate nucleotidase CysQ [Alphaproteobacteria bacterium]|nr:3'(2'),5'-bisphosphate nucleotidase CysQ [Alphaproteobacteria bacterium]
MTATDGETLLKALIATAARAGALIMRHYEEPAGIRHKEDESPVTLDDEEAEALILADLARLAPAIPVVSEEAAAAGHFPSIGQRFFLVDPLDGTKEFINKNGEFTVNIALIDRAVPVMGVVYAPALSRMFFGAGGGTAREASCDPHAKDAAGTPPCTGQKPIAARLPDAEGLVAVASRSHRDAKTDEYLAKYKIKDFRSAGSSLKFCIVAAGEADLYPRLGTTMEWDTAAGHAVLNAAGGSVTKLDGSPFLYGKVADRFKNDHFVARGRKA